MLSIEEIIKEYLRPIYVFAYRLSGNASDAEDITQEVFVKVWKHRKKYDSTQSFKTWIFAIARNTAIDWLRKRKSVHFSDFEDASGGNYLEDTLSDPNPLASELFERKEKETQLATLLGLVSLESRTIIILHDIEEMTFEEIAIIVRKPMNTVKSQYRRALQTIQSHTAHAPK